MNLMLIIFFISVLMIFSGSVYKILQRHSITEPFLALLLGILVGPDVLEIIGSASLHTEFKVLKIACEFTIAMALMATALRLPHNFFRRAPGTLSNQVIFGMILMCLASGTILFLLLPSFTFFECLLIGAVITPTDPVVASTMTTGETAKKYLPQFVRGSISFEAGVNDGLAYPLVFLTFMLAGSASFGMGEWFTRIFLYENVLCAILAYAVGVGAGFLMKKASSAGIMSEKTLLPFSLAVALLLLSGFDVLKMNGIIAVFAGGYAFAKCITANEDLEEERIQSAMERMTTVPVFFVLGLMLPWQEWFSLGWTAVAIVVLILFLRRIPAFLLMMPIMPNYRKKKFSVLLVGWFGPIGVASLYYAIHMKEKGAIEEVWIISSLMVVASTIVHGLTSVPLEKLYHRKSTRANEFPKE